MRAVLFCLLFANAVAAGCSAKLETGYEPRRLNSSDAERRGYYAAPFTPEAREAQAEREQESEFRRPNPGY